MTKHIKFSSEEYLGFIISVERDRFGSMVYFVTDPKTPDPAMPEFPAVVGQCDTLAQARQHVNVILSMRQ